MGVYYYLLDTTDNKKLHYNDYVKSGPVCFNHAVQMALINYMFDHPAHLFRFINDSTGEDECELYEEYNLYNYKFDGNLSEEIKKLMAKTVKLKIKDIIKNRVEYYTFKIKFWFSANGWNEILNRVIPYRRKYLISEKNFNTLFNRFNSIESTYKKNSVADTEMFIQLRNENEHMKRMLNNAKRINE